MAANSQFPVTRWTLVTRVREGDSPERESALGELCAAYWLPVYAFYRRAGMDVDDGKDMTQAFFELLLERDDFSKLERGKGKMRTFLLTAAKNFNTDQWRRRSALKRGGGAQVLSIDAEEAELKLAELEGDLGESPEESFDRQWAMTLLDRALAVLEAEYRANGRGDLFEALKPTLVADDSYAEAAERAGATEGAARVTAFRMRKRLRQIVEAELRETVAGPGDFEEELANFIAVFSG